MSSRPLVCQIETFHSCAPCRPPGTTPGDVPYSRHPRTPAATPLPPDPNPKERAFQFRRGRVQRPLQRRRSRVPHPSNGAPVRDLSSANRLRNGRDPIGEERRHENRCAPLSRVPLPPRASSGHLEPQHPRRVSKIYPGEVVTVRTNRSSPPGFRRAGERPNRHVPPRSAPPVSGGSIRCGWPLEDRVVAPPTRYPIPVG